ncbi:MAG: ornithine cyclodeaminase family protein [Alphaproteobacteria bacterium]|jgi:ornithine cyclodeaminase/alanine dehydrogenase-like protein (mu-crystallin family)|nr:ornithine cyclodeaminase family protein [Alphaproteobacteria bacterium]
MMFLDEAAVRKHVEIPDLIEAMRRAFIDFSAGKVQQPVRQMIPQHGGFFGIMPASGAAMGIKMVTYYPNNAEQNLPAHMAMIALFKPETGEPLAVMDGTWITEIRTAACSAVATEVMAPPDAKVLAILGTGVQGRAHVEVLPHVRDFEEIRVWNRTRANAERFVEEHGGVVMSAEEAVREADVIVTGTSAQEAILEGAWLKPGAHVNAVGSPRPDWRELDDAVMANVVVVDSYEGARTESGDVILSGCEVHAELGEVLAGTKPARADEITVFKSLGMAIEDVASASLVYENAKG